MKIIFYRVQVRSSESHYSSSPYAMNTG